MQTEKVHLTKEKETMLLAVYSRSMESRKKDSLLRDPIAEEAIQRIDYEFERTKPSRVESFQVVLRALQLDRWMAEFLKLHPRMLQSSNWAVGWTAVCTGSIPS